MKAPATFGVADVEPGEHPGEAGGVEMFVAVFTVAADGTWLDARGTMSHDGGPCEDDLRLTYEHLDS